MIQKLRTRAGRYLPSVGSYELAVLLTIVGVAAGIWAFGAIADEVMDGNTQPFDRAVLLAMRRSNDLEPIGPPALQEAARDITGLGGVAVLSMLTLTVSGFLIMDGKRRMALFVLCSVASGMLVTGSLKATFNRPRPDLVPHATRVSTPSFPSGHAMMAAVTYLTLGALLARSQERKRLKAFLMLLAAGLTFMIGLSRVYLGVHWPTDVFAGWTAGGSWALLCWFVARQMQSRRALESEAQHSPSLE